MLLQETPAVLSLGKLCEEHGYTYHWKSGQNLQLIKNGKRIDCNISNLVPFVVPGMSASSSSTTPSPISPSSSSQDSVFDVNRYTENPVPERSGSTTEELPKTPIKIGNRKKYSEIYRMNCLIGNRNSGRFRSMKVLQKSFGETWCRGVQTLPVRLMDLQWSREHTWNQVRVSIVYLRTFRRIRIVKYAWRPTKITRASCRRRADAVIPRAQKFGDLITADHKILSEESESRNNHRYAIVVQDLATQWLQSYSRGAGLGHTMDPSVKTSQETQKNLMKFLEPTRKPKVIYTDNSLEFGKSCEELPWNHCTSTPHRSETDGIAERAVRRVKECDICGAIAVRSG